MNRGNDDVRARDDARLRRRVSEARAAMKAQGFEERALDWEEVAREEQALWWRERVREALSELAASGQSLGATLLGGAQAALAAGAEAALEVTLDAARHVGRVLVDPARACVRATAGLEFTYAAASLRSGLGLAAGGPESVGIFIASTIPGARVIADGALGRLTVDFWKPSSPFVAILVPEDPGSPAHAIEVATSNETARAVFEDLQPGRYLLAVYPREPGGA